MGKKSPYYQSRRIHSMQLCNGIIERIARHVVQEGLLDENRGQHGSLMSPKTSEVVKKRRIDESLDKAFHF